MPPEILVRDSILLNEGIRVYMTTETDDRGNEYDEWVVEDTNKTDEHGEPRIVCAAKKQEDAWNKAYDYYLYTKYRLIFERQESKTTTRRVHKTWLEIFSEDKWTRKEHSTLGICIENEGLEEFFDKGMEYKIGMYSPQDTLKFLKAWDNCGKVQDCTIDRFQPVETNEIVETVEIKKIYTDENGNIWEGSVLKPHALKVVFAAYTNNDNYYEKA